MAIRITLDKLVKTLRPANGQTFNIEELNNAVNGWVDPFKVGPVWVMTLEKSKEKGNELNELASYFFEVALHGEVIVVPPQQLPLDWDLMNETDKMMTADMVDSGFLLSLQNAIMLKKTREQYPEMKINAKDFFNSQFNIKPKEEYTYEIPTEKELDEKTLDFLEKVYEYMKTSPAQFKKGIILDESQVTIRTQKENLKKLCDLMKDIYVKTEDYEKCAVIQHIEEQF